MKKRQIHFLHTYARNDFFTYVFDQKLKQQKCVCAYICYDLSNLGMENNGNGAFGMIYVMIWAIWVWKMKCLIIFTETMNKIYIENFNVALNYINRILKNLRLRLQFAEPIFWCIDEQNRGQIHSSIILYFPMYQSKG